MRWPGLVLTLLVGLVGQGPTSSAVSESEHPLHHALASRDYESALAAMPLMLDINASAAGEDGIEAPAICLAAQDPSADAYDMAQALLERYGADPKLYDGRGLTALHYAAHNGNLAVVELLLNSGAEANASLRVADDATDAQKQQAAMLTPLYMAYQQGRYRVAALLERRGAGKVEEQALLQAKLQGALAEGYRLARQNQPEGLSFLESVRFEQGVATVRAQEFLRAHGMHGEAAMVGDLQEVVLRLIEDTPLPESTDPVAGVAWMQQVQAKAWKAMAERFPESVTYEGGTDAQN